MEEKEHAVIVGAGIMDVPAYPVDFDSFGQVSFPAGKISLGFGGDALNEAVALARMGSPVRLVSKVGADLAGRLVLAHCEEEGIDVRFLRVEEGLDTGINIVLVDGAGQRRFIANQNGSLRRLALDDIDTAAFEGAKLLCLASIFVSPLLPPVDMEALLTLAKDRGLITCADFTTPKNGEGLREMAGVLSRLDYALPSRAEAAALTAGFGDPADMADALLGAGAGNVVIKLGGEGCYIANSRVRKTLPAVSGVQAVDTTGAGDSFVAGFLYGLMEGWDFEECALMANAAGSLAVEAFGAGAGIRDLPGVLERFWRYKEQRN